MPHNFAVLADVHLLPETQDQIQELASEKINFPSDHPEENALIERTGAATIVLVSPGTKITEGYFDNCPSVRHVIICGTSKANIDLASAASHNVQIHNITHYGDDVAAETIMNRLQDLLSSGRTNLQDLKGASMGIVGLGAVGSAIAAQAQRSGMHASYFGPHQKPNTTIPYRPLLELLASSDVIVLSGPGNQMVLGEAEFGAIKPRAILVQVSQGDITDIEALKKWASSEGNFVLLDGAAGNETRRALGDAPNAQILAEHSGYSLKSRQLLGQKVVSTLKQILG